LQRSEAGQPAYLLGVPQLPPEGAGAFERLLELGVVVHGPRLEAWDPCPNCSCGAEQRPIRWKDGTPYAACPVACADDERLDPGELQLFEISIGRLAELTARGAGLGDHPSEVTPGLWRLGRLSGRVVALAASGAAARAPGCLDRLKTIDPAVRLALIAALPSAVEVAALAERGVDVIDPTEAFLPSSSRRPVQVNVERLSSLVANHDPDLLVVNPMAMSCELGGRPLRLEPRDMRVLIVLAREANDGDAAATRDDLYRALVNQDDAEASVGDEQVDKSISRIRGALCDARGLQRSDGTRLISAIRGHGYRLVLGRVRVLIR
jgi:DNA-binding winged helix-turn-helix (wHTH) protein